MDEVKVTDFWCTCHTDAKESFQFAHKLQYSLVTGQK